MRNSLFLGGLIAGILILTLALTLAIIDHDSSVSVPINDNSIDNSYTPPLSTMKTSDLAMVTNNKGSHARVDMTIYRPMTMGEGWYWIGDLVETSYNASTRQVTLVHANDPGALAAPVDWKLVWTDYGSGGILDTSIWRPVPPKGYVALGCVAVQGYNKPVLPGFRCVKKEYCVDAIEDKMIWNDHGSGSRMDVALWSITAEDANGLDALTFWARGDYNQYPEDSVYCLNMDKIA